MAACSHHQHTRLCSGTSLVLLCLLFHMHLHSSHASDAHDSEIIADQPDGGGQCITFEQLAHLKSLLSESSHLDIDNSAQNASRLNAMGNITEGLLPSFIYQLEASLCTVRRHRQQDVAQKQPEQHRNFWELPLSVWLCALGAITAISMVGLICVAIIPLTSKVVYNHLLQFLVALAVGSLTGDACLHLLPHALTGGHGHSGSVTEETHDHVEGSYDHVEGSNDHVDGTHDHSAVYKGLVALLGIYVFFLIEQSMKIYSNMKRRVRQLQKAEETPANADTADGTVRSRPRQPTVGEVAGASSCQQTLLVVHKDVKEWAQDAHDDVYYHCPVTANNSPQQATLSSTTTLPPSGHSSHQHRRRPCHQKLCSANRSSANGRSVVESGRDMPDGRRGLLTDDDDEAKVTNHNGQRGLEDSGRGLLDSGSDGLTNEMQDGAPGSTSAVEPCLKTNGFHQTDRSEEHSSHVDLAVVEEDEVHCHGLQRSHSHGHSHGHDGRLPGSVAAVAWMVVMGDGIHNFGDGLAIGTAFATNISVGLSTTVAVFCHELPHEIGDFAVLLRAGMSPRQAIVYNLVSSILAAVGMLVGLMLGNISSASLWIFALIGGMFIYVALVDMLPELTAVGPHGQEHPLLHLFLQNAGLLLGASIMLLIALFEEKISLSGVL